MKIWPEKLIMAVILLSEQLKKNYFWNTLGSLMNAASAVPMLMVVRTIGPFAGGVFSLTYAVKSAAVVAGLITR